MSETIAEIKPAATNSEDDFLGYEVVRYKNGREHLYGLKNTEKGVRKVHVANRLAELYGHDRNAWKDYSKDPDKWNEQHLVDYRTERGILSPTVSEAVVVESEPIVTTSESEPGPVGAEVDKVYVATKPDSVEPTAERLYETDANATVEPENSEQTTEQVYVDSPEDDYATSPRLTFQERLARWRNRIADAPRRVMTRVQTYEERVSEAPDRRREVVVAIGMLAVAGLAYWLGTRTGHHGNIFSKNELLDLKENIKDLHGVNAQQQDLIIQNHQALKANNHEIRELLTQNHRLQAKVNAANHMLHSLVQHEQSEAAGTLYHNWHHESLEYYGNTIWADVSADLSRNLGRAPTNAEIYKLTDYVLRLNHLSWEQARHLPVGYNYEMPNNIAQLAR